MVVDPLGFSSYPLVSTLLRVAFIAVLTVTLYYSVKRYVRPLLIHRLPRHVSEVILKIASYSILFAGSMAILAELGVNVNTILVAGGIAGIAIGIAGQTVASNLISGIFLYAERPFNVGDPVSIDGNGGIVQDISMFSTKVRRWDGVIIRLPNEAVFRSRIEVYNSSLIRRVEYRIPLSYEADIAKAREAVWRVIEREPLALAEPPPQVFVDSLTDRSEVVVRFWAPSSKWFDAKMKVLESIVEELLSEGIRIEAPRRRIEVARDSKPSG